MGCDIHAHFEIKVNNKWLHYSQPNIKRNYALFEKMAGVRGDIKNSVSLVKGQLDNFNETTALAIKVYGSDGHTHSWLSKKEIIAVCDFHENQQKGKPFYFIQDEWGYLFGNSWHNF